MEQETSGGRDGPEAAAALTVRLKYRVAFETGDTESHEGGGIEIGEVWGTRPKPDGPLLPGLRQRVLRDW